MPYFGKRNKGTYTRRKSNQTGEDFDMLHEEEMSPQVSSRKGSYKYKDHEDGA